MKIPEDVIKARLKKSKGRCECRGQCEGHDCRCTNFFGQQHLFDDSSDIYQIFQLVRAPKKGWKIDHIRLLCPTCNKTYQTYSQKTRGEIVLTEEIQRVIGDLR